MCETYIHLFIKKIFLEKEAKGYKQKNIGDRGCLGRVFYFRWHGDGESLTRCHLTERHKGNEGETHRSVKGSVLHREEKSLQNLK